MCDFYVGAGDLNTVPHACAAGMGPTMPPTALLSLIEARLRFALVIW